jgi:hypothetical protein
VDSDLWVVESKAGLSDAQAPPMGSERRRELGSTVQVSADLVEQVRDGLGGHLKVFGMVDGRVGESGVARLVGRM